MNELIEGVRSALAVWPLWLILVALSAIAWKLPKHKAKTDYTNAAETLNKDMFAQSTGMPMSNGLLSPFNSDKRDKF